MYLDAFLLMRLMLIAYQALQMYVRVQMCGQGLKTPTSSSSSIFVPKVKYMCAVRDDRRSGQLVNGTNKKHMVTYNVDMSEKSPVSFTPCPNLVSHGVPWVINGN